MTLAAQAPDPAMDGLIKLACLAVGGQGGGVLTGWLIGVAERNGYAVQSTSVAGVAQRTGATIYYVEMMPRTERPPVFALSPAEGDVDILVAAEWMEAGRAILRGFVTPDRTTLIASTHRALATAEKIVPGTGFADPAEVRRAAETQAKRLVAFDMERVALEAGSVISASLFGAIAGAGVLPFPVESFRATIEASGRGVGPSLAAFDAACATVQGQARIADPAPQRPRSHPVDRAVGPSAQVAAWTALRDRVAELPAPVQCLASAGLRKCVDWLDLAYGAEYLDRLDAMVALDRTHGGAKRAYAFATEAAKALANALCYDDIPRVADLKTRPGRPDRIAAEVGATEAHVVQVTEYVHPGAAEVVSLMPARLGHWIEARPGWMRRLDWAVNRGRHLRTDAVLPFLSLWVVAGLRTRRRGLLRHGREMAHVARLQVAACDRIERDYAAATAVWRVQRLVKGYSDTHARGLSKVDRVLDGLALVDGRADAAQWIDRLIAAALQDPKGTALDGALATIRSFSATEAPPLVAE